MRYKRSRVSGEFVAVAVGGLLLALLLALVPLYVYGTAFEEVATVEERFTRVTGGGESPTRQVYMVTLTDGRSMQVSDSFLRLHFRSTDVWTSLRAGETYRLHAYGWRVPFLSMFPNIYRAQPTP